MFGLILTIVLCCLAFGMLTDPVATIPFAIAAAVFVSVFLVVRFFWPGKDRTKPGTYAVLDLLALLSPWH